jgi:hypothetical protein
LTGGESLSKQVDFRWGLIRPDFVALTFGIALGLLNAAALKNVLEQAGIIFPQVLLVALNKSKQGTANTQVKIVRLPLLSRLRNVMKSILFLENFKCFDFLKFSTPFVPLK